MMAVGNERRMMSKSRSNAVKYEVMLQEMMSVAGVSNIPAGHRNARKLACHMALLGELISAQAFGSLQHIMNKVVEEIYTCMYTCTVCVVSAPQILDICPADKTKIHKVPFFAEYDSIQAELLRLREATHESHEQCKNAENQYKSANKKLISANAKEDQLNADIQVLKKQIDILQAEVATLKDNAKKKVDLHEIEVRSLTLENKKLRQSADRAKLELAFIKSQREEDKSLRETFASLHAASPCHPADSLNTLHDQLNVLLHAQIDEFESGLVDACDSFEEERLREEFIAEVGSVDREIVALRSCIEAKVSSPNNQGINGKFLPNELPFRDLGMENTNDTAQYLFPDELVEKEKPDYKTCAGTIYDGNVNQTELLWEAFLQRCDHSFKIPMTPRVISEDKLVAIIEDTFRVKHEDWQNAITHENMTSFFYSFIHDVYGVPNVAMLVIHGVLVATLQLRKSNPVVCMFHDLLTCALDEAAWKYSMCWRTLLKKCSVVSIHDLQEFISLAYVGYSSKELSSFASHYMKESQLCSSGSLLSYLTDQLMCRTELRLKKWLSILRWRDAQQYGGLLRAEFDEVAKEYFPHISQNGILQYSNHLGASWAPLESWGFVCCCLEIAEHAN